MRTALARSFFIHKDHILAREMGDFRHIYSLIVSRSRKIERAAAQYRATVKHGRRKADRSLEAVGDAKSGYDTGSIRGMSNEIASN